MKGALRPASIETRFTTVAAASTATPPLPIFTDVDTVSKGVGPALRSAQGIRCWVTFWPLAAGGSFWAFFVFGSEGR